MRIPVEANATVLAWVGERAEREPKRVRVRRRTRPESSRCHPELSERLRAIANDLGPVRPVYVEGLAALVHPNRVVFAIAGGTRWMALRLPRRAHGAVVRSGTGRRGLDGDWVDVDPWLTDQPAVEGTRRLRGWARAAYEYAGELGAPRGA